MRLILASVSALALVACSGPAATPNAESASAEVAPAAAPAEAPAAEVKYGKTATYKMDPNHASLIWRVKHMGLSNYTARFTDFDVSLQFDATNASATSVTATINPTSVETDFPGDFKAGHPDSPYNGFDEEIGQSPAYFNAGQFPQITFQSTAVTPTGPDTGTVTGDLTFLGVTKPITLDVKYNGVANFPWAPDEDHIGFSATTTLTRSDFGFSTGAPYVGDEVEVIIEAEFGEVVAGGAAPE